MKKLKRILFLIEEPGTDGHHILVFSTTPKRCFQDYCFHKRFIKQETEGLFKW